MKQNLITTALLLSASTFVQAETNKTELAPVNVYSAYATPVNQDKTASSVTVLTEKDFAERNATYVSDVLKTVPGVVTVSRGGRGTLTQFSLRGARANQAAIVIDGVKMKPVNNLGFDFGGLALSNIERIEVLRGEQSALWGSDAMGGVIYITTKSGLYKDKPFNVDFDLGTGSHRTRDASATISGYQDGFYYAVHGDSHRTAGISAKSSHSFNYTAVDGTAVKTGGMQEKDKFHRDNASIRLGYDVGNKGVEFLTSHSSQTAHFDSDDHDETAFDDFSRTRETIFKLSGYVGSDDELLKHQINLNHTKTKNNRFELSPYSANIESTYNAKKLDANYQLNINFDRDGYVKQAASILAEYQKANYHSSEFAKENQGEKKLAEKSIAGEYRLFTEDDHALSLSGRYTGNSQYENVFTGRIAGAYRLSPNFRAHTSLGSAIQNPTLTDFYGYNGTYKGNPNLKPAKSLGGEVGLLIESTDKTHSLDTTYFARNVENFISAGNKQSVNLEGTTKIKGVEVIYNGKLTKELSAYVNYTYTQAKDNQGKSLARLPKHTANAGMAYQITEKFGTNANVSYVGKRTDLYFTPDWNSHNVKSSSYTLVNLGANYQVMPNLNIYANLNNLFNKKYENVLGYGQDGRNVYVGLKSSF